MIFGMFDGDDVVCNTIPTSDDFGADEDHGRERVHLDLDRGGQLDRYQAENLSDTSAESNRGEVGSDWFPAKGVTVGSVIEAFMKYSEYERLDGFEVHCQSSRLSVEGKKLLGDGCRRMKMQRDLARD